MTRGYRGLQGITRGYQGAARGYRGLQWVTWGQDVTVKLTFSLERPQILFLGLFCIKIKDEEI